MSLDPQVKVLLEYLQQVNSLADSSLTPAEIRANNTMAQKLGKPTVPVASSEDRTIPGPNGPIPLRIYTPFGHGPFPLFIFLHGGGWVLGDIPSYDNFCHQMTNRAKAIVISVDYRLAPEHKFPAAPQDCYAATQWVAEHASELNGDPARIAIGGDSAGGNLSAVVTQLARDQHGPQLCFQLLIYPSTDMTADTPSMHENASGYYLTAADMRWFAMHYLPDEKEQYNPLASPYLAEDLHGLPPALVITCEYDPLRDEGERYAQRLQEAGVPVTLHRYDGMIHGFITLSAILQQARTAVQECGTALRDALAPQLVS